MGAELGPESVSTMVKHFPGGGPQLDGEDPHFEWLEEADVAILRIKAPFEERDRGGFSAMFHSGSLEFPAAEHARLTAIADAVPTVIDVYLDRPAVLGGLEESALAVLANYGASDEAVLRVLFGERGPQGSLPFDLPVPMRRSWPAAPTRRSTISNAGAGGVSPRAATGSS